MTNGVMDEIVDHYIKGMIQDPYTEHAFSMFTTIQKLTPRAIIEAGMRAESGKAIKRTLGSPIMLSDWHKILLNPVHMFRLPTEDSVQIKQASQLVLKRKSH